MKRLWTLVSLLAAVAVFLASQSAKADGVEYFKYWTIDARDYPYAKTAGANLNFAHAGTVDGLVQQVGAIRKEGSKALVFLDFIVFAGQRPENGLLAEAHANWTAFVAAINAAGYQDAVAGFYLSDEPYSTSHGDHNAMASVYINLKSVASWIKADLAKPVAVIISVPELRDPMMGYTLPSPYLKMFDWVGFDCYDAWTSCQGVPMSDHIATLKRLLGPGQRMIAAPQGCLPDLNAQDYVIQTNINPWETEIASNPSYVLVLPFAWNQCHSLGIADLPVVKERFRRMAHSLLSPNTPYAPPAWKSATPVLFQ